VFPHRQKRSFAAFAVAILAGIFCLLIGAPEALANGVPMPWGIGMQDAASPVQAHIEYYHNILLVLITFISVFVLALLLYVIARYNRWMNPVPSNTAHNIKLEIVWTLVPCFILLGLAFISFPLLYYSDRMPTPDMTLKVTGHQWYWSYEYPDQADINFDSHAIWDSSDVTQDQANKLIKDASQSWLIKSQPLRLLEVDNRLVLPVGQNIRVDITGGDVEHSWFIPSVAVNRMAVPGRNSEVWLKIKSEGIYYGQCSMICGQGHGYMPIVIEAVSLEKFADWVKSKKPDVGSLGAPAHFATAETGNAQ